MHNFQKCVALNYFFLAVLTFIGLATALSVQAQNINPQTRSITSDDFASQRPAAPRKTGAGKSQTSALRRARYKQIQPPPVVLRRKQSNNSNPRPSSNPATTTQPAKISEIGVTMWRLRPSRSSDTGPKIGVQLPDGNRANWTPERVSTETTFRAGDKVRFAVESAVAGYLYIVNSELYADGRIGEPFLIFPGTVNEDNSVRPGLLFDIPDQSEDLPYFSLTEKSEDYAGELLTIIVSPRPLTNLKTDVEGRIRNADNLAELEENTSVELYAKTDGAGETYSEAEAQSTCGQKARRLKRENLQSCVNSRQLTRAEPLPQTIYRVKAAVGKPAILFVRMSVGQK